MEMPPVARIVASNGLSNHRPSNPVGSNGASSALLDAAEIASTLAAINVKKKTRISHNDICKALKDFEKVRLPIATSVQLTCREMLPEKVMDRVHLVKLDAKVLSRAGTK
jgi:2-polyprenyl-6-methoxyphenol hydroxylase-like FAD-dependent oxidoreductase